MGLITRGVNQSVIFLQNIKPLSPPPPPHTPIHSLVVELFENLLSFEVQMYQKKYSCWRGGEQHSKRQIAINYHKALILRGLIQY